MNEIRFEWDSEKAKLNAEKHGVTFEEAESVFYDEQAIQFYDDEHSEWEDRFLMLGLSVKLKLFLFATVSGRKTQSSGSFLPGKLPKLNPGIIGGEK